MKKLVLSCVLVLAMSSMVSVRSSSGEIPSFSGLGLGLKPNYAYAVSPEGICVVGTSATTLGNEAFYWTESNGILGLGDFSGGDFGSYAYDVSFGGEVVVGYGHNSDNNHEAFRWANDDGMIGLDDLPGGAVYSHAYGVSDDGCILVGNSISSNGYEAFRWTEAGGMIGLGDLPGGAVDSRGAGISGNGQVIVGESYSTLGQEAYRWTLDDGMVGLGDLPGGMFKSAAYAASSDGRVIVGKSSSSASGNTDDEAFRWTIQDGMVGLGDLPGGKFNSEARAVSGNGAIVVGTATSALDNKAFIWDEFNGMRPLRDVLVNDYGLDLTGWALHCATGISADGSTIVGFGGGPEGDVEAWIATIPEPCTLSLLALGGLVLGRRRR